LHPSGSGTDKPVERELSQKLKKTFFIGDYQWNKDNVNDQTGIAAGNSGGTPEIPHSYFKKFSGMHSYPNINIHMLLSSICSCLRTFWVRQQDLLNRKSPGLAFVPVNNRINLAWTLKKGGK
jgi:hypothetical protein